EISTAFGPMTWLVRIPRASRPGTSASAYPNARPRGIAHDGPRALSGRPIALLTPIEPPIANGAFSAYAYRFAGGSGGFGGAGGGGGGGGFGLGFGLRGP